MMVATAMFTHGVNATLLGLAAATVFLALPARAHDVQADKALMEALAKDEQEFKAALKEVPRSSVIGTVARGPGGFYITSLRPGEDDLISSSGSTGRRSEVSAMAEGARTTQGGQ